MSKINISEQVSLALADIQDEQGEAMIEGIDGLMGFLIGQYSDGDARDIMVYLGTLHSTKQWLKQLRNGI